jgi:selenocysteine lyase/cysteine desulfurase
MSPLPRIVEEAGIAGMRRKRNPTGIGENDFFNESRQLRKQFAQLVNAEHPNRIAIIPSVSYGVATAAKNVNPGPGDNIVLVEQQFPSNVYAWHRLAATTGAEIRTAEIPRNSNRRGEQWNRTILQSIDANTSVVAASHVHWADGTRFDLDSIGERAREVDAALIIDATQSVGAVPFDIQELQPDALITAGYKWLFGPYSLGVAYFGPRLSDGIPLEENWITRQGSENFSELVNYEEEYQPGAVRYDMGERSNFILLPMLNTALRLVLDWSVESIQRYCQKLTRSLIEDLRTEGWTIESEPWRAHHLFGIRVPETVDVNAVQAELIERNVAVSVRGNAVRISPNIYNTPEDIQALHRALQAAAN